jgi:hypothetical protein
LSNETVPLKGKSAAGSRKSGQNIALNFASTPDPFD